MQNIVKQCKVSVSVGWTQFSKHILLLRTFYSFPINCYCVGLFLTSQRKKKNKNKQNQNKTLETLHAEIYPSPVFLWDFFHISKPAVNTKSQQSAAIQTFPKQYCVFPLPSYHEMACYIFAQLVLNCQKLFDLKCCNAYEEMDSPFLRILSNCVCVILNIARDSTESLNWIGNLNQNVHNILRSENLNGFILDIKRFIESNYVCISAAVS